MNAISKFVVRGNTLVINYVDETDNGRYSCQTFNDYDRRGQRAEYLLNVIGNDLLRRTIEKVSLIGSSTSSGSNRSASAES